MPLTSLALCLCLDLWWAWVEHKRCKSWFHWSFRWQRPHSLGEMHVYCIYPNLWLLLYHIQPVAPFMSLLINTTSALVVPAVFLNLSCRCGALQWYLYNPNNDLLLRVLAVNSLMSMRSEACSKIRNATSEFSTKCRWEADGSEYKKKDFTTLQSVTLHKLYSRVRLNM